MASAKFLLQRVYSSTKNKKRAILTLVVNIEMGLIAS